MYNDLIVTAAPGGIGELGRAYLPEFVDYMVGNQSVPAVEKEFGGVYPDAKLNAYVNEIGQKLVPFSKREDWPYKFQVLNTDMLNAFALPNGNIYVTKGLMATLTNEAQLAAVLGHEIRHVSDRHGIKQLERSLGGSFLMKLAQKAGWVKGDLAAIQGAIFQLLTSGYSRDHELDADAGALNIMYGAGYNPVGAVQLMQLFQSMEGDRPKDLEYYFRSHPLAKERVEELKDRINSRFPLREDKTFGESRYMRETDSLRNGVGVAGYAWVVPVGVGLIVTGVVWAAFKRL